MTRLHVRYDAKSFPEDLAFVETKDRTNFQGRYVLHHPWQGEASCAAGAAYRAALPARFTQEAAKPRHAHRLVAAGYRRADGDDRAAGAGKVR